MKQDLTGLMTFIISTELLDQTRGFDRILISIVPIAIPPPFYSKECPAQDRAGWKDATLKVANLLTTAETVEFADYIVQPLRSGV